MKIRKAFAAAALGVLTSAFAQAQEVTVQIPSVGKTIKFDCGLLHVENKQLWLTEEAIHTLDKAFGGVSISSEGLTSKAELAPDAATRGQQLSNNLYLFGAHLSRQHYDCIKQMGDYEQKKGLKPEKIYGEDWQSRTNCVIMEVTSKCRVALIK